MSKVLFFDIDGTLVNFSGKMPESTLRALHQARAKGHKCFICTGRSYNQIYSGLLEFGFDGIVAATGSYVEYEGKELVRENFGEQRVKEIIALLGDNGTCMLFQNKDKSIVADRWTEGFERAFSDNIKKSDDSENDTFRNLITDNNIEDYCKKYSDTESVIYCECPYTLEELKEKLPQGLKVTPSSFKKPDPYSGEITLAHTNKATGIQAVMDALGVKREDLIGFGDGANDIDMLEFVGTGVAMGNAQQVAKDAADIIAEHIDDDGLYKIMQTLELI